MANAASERSPEPDPQTSHREVRFEYSLNLPTILDRLGISLLVSTYQAGKVVVVGVHEGKLAISCHNFERAMGLAVRPDRIAVATQSEIWTLRDTPELAPRLAPSGSHEAAFLARQAHCTGDIQAHEIAFGSGPPARWGQGSGQSSAGFELWGG
jgi:uncharacterized protein (TIGR03032 family)